MDNYIPLLNSLMDDLLRQIADKFYQNNSSVVGNRHKDVMLDSVRLLGLGPYFADYLKQSLYNSTKTFHSQKMRNEISKTYPYSNCNNANKICHDNNKVKLRQPSVCRHDLRYRI